MPRSLHFYDHFRRYRAESVAISAADELATGDCSEVPALESTVSAPTAMLNLAD